MFGKVFKYEMKAVRRILLPLYGAMILVALLFALSTSLTSDLSAARDGLPVFVDIAELITSISCTDHMTAHALITWMVIH